MGSKQPQLPPSDEHRRPMPSPPPPPKRIASSTLSRAVAIARAEYDARRDVTVWDVIAAAKKRWGKVEVRVIVDTWSHPMDGRSEMQCSLSACGTKRNSTRHIVLAPTLGELLAKVESES